MRAARAEMLTALAVGWLTVQVSASQASAPAVIIAGADEITRPHLERLADACEGRSMPLTLMFPPPARRTPWPCSAAAPPTFMRLGNHAEAEQAASYIGRQHKFVLSQFTATAGGNQSFTRSDTDSYSDGTSSSAAGRNSTSVPAAAPAAHSASRSWSTGSSWADGHQLERCRLHPAGLRIRRRASHPSCRTSPTAPSCSSPTRPAGRPCSCAQSNAIPPSPPCQVLARGRWRRTPEPPRRAPRSEGRSRHKAGQPRPFGIPGLPI